VKIGPTAFGLWFAWRIRVIRRPACRAMGVAATSRWSVGGAAAVVESAQDPGEPAVELVVSRDVTRDFGGLVEVREVGRWQLCRRCGAGLGQRPEVSGGSAPTR
jgi:hypothetical protein